MGWNLTTELDEYIAAAGPYLSGDPVEHTVQLTVIETMRLRGTGVFGGERPLLGWWSPGGHGVDGEPGQVRGALLRTGAYPVLLSAVPDSALDELTEVLSGRADALEAVSGRTDIAQAFATRWERRTGVTGRVGMRQRLHRLERLAPPERLPDGKARIAAAADRETVLAWWEMFHREAHGAGTVSPEVVDDRIGHSGVMLWEVAGRPVAMAGRNRIVAGTARIAPVYTLPEHRGRRYGSAVTAAATRAALDSGAREVVLFTDLANPTSNAIYRRLGYRPVSDRVIIRLER